MAIELPALPYDRTALEPHISGETIDFHYGKIVCITRAAPDTISTI